MIKIQKLGFVVRCTISWLMALKVPSRNYIFLAGRRLRPACVCITSIKVAHLDRAHEHMDGLKHET